MPSDTCKRGHLLDEKNAAVRPSGRIVCRACDADYQRRRRAPTLVGESRWSDERRLQKIESRIDRVDSGCWLWRGGVNQDGYGAVKWRGVMYGAHRFVYEALVGPIPENMTLDHLCRVRRCVNPEHLDPVTLRRNILRGASLVADNARKTHCHRGHEFNEENTHWKGRSRNCRACAREWAREHRASLRVNAA